MKPRIFISSTFYDLRYVREDLANFVKSYDYEPILFEDGDIGYKPGRNPDTSCYEALKNADMVILIIGGEYGSTASGEKEDGFEEYMSVTRTEYRTAIEEGIPVFVMINKQVMAEYGIYEMNLDCIEKENLNIKFASTKNINVFRFIKEIKSMVNLPIQEFEKVADIKKFISKQWADMFKNYLNSLKQEKEDEQMKHSVNEMKELIKKMDIMLDRVGKNVLSRDDPQEYVEVVNRQYIQAFCGYLTDAYRIRLSSDRNKTDSAGDRKEVINDFLDAVKDVKSAGVFDKPTVAMSAIFDKISKIFEDHNIVVDHIYRSEAEKVCEKTEELLSDKEKREDVVEILIQDRNFELLLS